MAEITLGGNPVNTSGDLPAVGSPAPAFELTALDLRSLSSTDLAGQNVVLNIFPSIDTGVCATSVRTFNERAAGLENTTILNVSADLPFAQKRFCGAEGIENASSGSTFRSPGFGEAYGTTLVDSGMAGLHARAVVVINAEGNVAHAQLVGEIAEEPDYDTALSAIS
jgi:thiol peroxidase